MHKLLIGILGMIMTLLLGSAEQAFAFSQDLHRDITESRLSFLKSDILRTISDANVEVDISQAFSSQWHFDNCDFREGTENINRLYRHVVALLDPTASDPNLLAAAAFGQLLHPAQDLYSHSNWIELGQINLIDSGERFWSVLTPFTSVRSNNVFVIQGEEVPRGYGLRRDGKVVTVYHSGSSSLGLGLITGTVYISDDCPDSIALGHWDSGSMPPDLPSFAMGSGSGLNKDSPERPGYDDARRLAELQTTHEWCRLVDLVEAAYGLAGRQVLYQNWVADPVEAYAACPSVTLIISTNPFVGRAGATR
jgi:hypothetical protein